MRSESRSPGTSREKVLRRKATELRKRRREGQMPEGRETPEGHETPEAQAAKYIFFVYVVESPSAPDIYHGRSEGGLVVNALGLDAIPCVSRTAINREAFVAALRIGLTEAMKEFPGRYPILHLSAHGSNEGIQLST